jgi:hypothetical protein
VSKVIRWVPLPREDGAVKLMPLPSGGPESFVSSPDYDSLAAENVELRRCLDGGVDCAGERIEAKKLLREALREMTTATAPRSSFTDCVDKIDAFLTAHSGRS